MTGVPITATEALRQAEAALRRAPEDPRLLLQRAHCLLALGHTSLACASAAAAQLRAAKDAAVLDAIGNLFSRASDQARALAAFDQAVALAPNEPHFAFNRATVRRFLGDIDGAEEDYDRVIRQKPQDYEAYLNRSELRVQSADRNHTVELEARLPAASAWRGQAALRYALAKEYEDLGQYARSFEHLACGARVRREHLRYDVGTDVATVDWIIEAHPGLPLAQVQATPAHAARADDAPIFIVGLPRSGSTLIERILGSHSTIRAAGELPHFALAVVAAAVAVPGKNRGSISRQELVRQSAEIDFAQLGRDYLARVRAAGITAARFTDKMPLNYLYCGLIHRALPRARIVHVRRHPMAACYAMFKTLFQDGYPFSYDLEELGRYYVAYERLMHHWQSRWPGFMHELSYEALIADQRGESQRLLAFCGLGWEEACMQFQANAAPSTTASAVQVRRPLYDTAVAQWRNYARQLEPLRRQLLAANINVEE
ncbi:MAG TPA: sulfotransferase [Steroidobacteraceae bacterium]|nr:sulfotransferase [Steroidobacteraceae bacterium]